MIDLHCHILPGVDDGPSTLEDSLAMARVAVAAGTRTIVATPHVSWEWQANDATRIAAKVAEVNDALAGAGIDLEVLPGAEIALTRAADLDDDELRRLRLGSGPWLLIECPFVPSGMGFDAALHDLQRRGHRIVLAHAERCPAFQRKPEQLDRLLDQGMLASITASSLAGGFGRTVKAFAQELMASGQVHNVASDGHEADGHRAPRITPLLVDAGYRRQAEWLSRDVPHAVITGAQLPSPPPLEPDDPRGLLRRLGRRLKA